MYIINAVSTTWLYCLLQKLNRRTQALGKIDWEGRKKEQMADVLREDFMSSEDSDSGKEVYKVKTLPWESEQLSKNKRRLDEFHASRQSMHSQQRFVKRVRITGATVREQPSDCPAWACNNYNNDNEEHGV